MDKLEPTKDLVKEVLEVLIREPLAGGDDTVQVRLHEVRNDVHIREVDGVGGHRDDILDSDNVFMVSKVPQELDLTQDTLGVHEVVKHPPHLFNGDLYATQPP